MITDKGIERIFGIGVNHAHEWSNIKIKKTWKAIVTRPAFENNLILVKSFKSLIGPGGSALSLTSRLCNTEPAGQFCSIEHGFNQQCDHHCIAQHTGKYTICISVDIGFNILW